MQRSHLALVFFENEEDYTQGDATLNAMPTGDTPGQRTSVTKYNVAVRMTICRGDPSGILAVVGAFTDDRPRPNSLEREPDAS
jgi:hypothetical protein